MWRAGICVHACNGSGSVLGSTQTDSSGAYTLTSLPAGSADAGFSMGCGAGNYLTQYHKDKATLAGADAVTVSGGTTTSEINAAMVGKARITGTVTTRATNAPLAGI